MSIRCRECGHLNDDGLGFCNHCGEPIDPNVKFAMELKGLKETKSSEPQRKSSSEEHYVYREPVHKKKEKKKSSAPWVFLGIAAIAVVLWLIL